MTDNEPKTDHKLGAAGWTVLLFILAVVGSIIGAVIYLLVQYANTFGGAS